MKRLLVMLVALLSITFTCHANDQEIVDSFRNFTGNIISEIQDSYDRGDYSVRYIPDMPDLNIKYNYWVKTGYTNLQSSIDVKKTDSLVSPYLGILNISNQKVSYYTATNPMGEFVSKEAAEQATMKKVDYTNQYQFFYAYQNGEWVLKQSKELYPDGRWRTYKFSPLSVCIIRK